MVGSGVGMGLVTSVVGMGLVTSVVGMGLVTSVVGVGVGTTEGAVEGMIVVTVGGTTEVGMPV